MFLQDSELRNDVVPKRNAGGLAYDYVIGEDSPYQSSTIRPPHQLKVSPHFPPQNVKNSQKQQIFNHYPTTSKSQILPKRKVPIVETRTPAYYNLDVVPTTPTPYFYPNYYGKNLEDLILIILKYANNLFRKYISNS